MRLVEKRGQAPRITLEKAEVTRMYESSYLFKRMGALLERVELIELSAKIKLALDEVAPEWQVDDETGELTKRAKETPAPEVKPPTKPKK